jgi:hypothetical protein
MSLASRASAVPSPGRTTCTPGAVSSSSCRSMPYSSMCARRSSPRSCSISCRLGIRANIAPMRSESSFGASPLSAYSTCALTSAGKVHASSVAMRLYGALRSISPAGGARPTLVRRLKSSLKWPFRPFSLPSSSNAI